MERVSRLFGLTQRPSQRGPERTGQPLAIRFSTITGGAGTGGKSSILVRYTLLSLAAPSTHTITGINLRKGVEKAWKWGKTQREVAKSLDGMVSEGTLRRWEKLVAEYRRDPSKPNPFKEQENCKSSLPPAHFDYMLTHS